MLALGIASRNAAVGSAASDPALAREPGAGGTRGAVPVEDDEDVELWDPREARGNEMHVLGLPPR